MDHKIGRTRWARGFFRAWVALSVAWFALIGVIAWMDFPSENHSSFMIQGESQHYTITEVYAKADQWAVAGDTEAESKLRSIGDEKRAALDDAKRESLVNWLRVTAIPPGLLLLVGFIVAWVLSGFRSGPSSPAKQQ